MPRRVLIIHGWGGSPNEPMLQWLKTNLEENGLEAVLPEMPDTENPIIKDWVEKLKEIIRNPDKDTILVGHSIGCQAILRYLERLDSVKQVGKVVFIAPWFTLSNLESDEEWETAKPWLNIPVKETDIIKHMSKMVAIFSDNDPFIPAENIELFRRRFNAEIIIEHQKGHFREEDGVKSLESALRAILKNK